MDEVAGQSHGGRGQGVLWKPRNRHHERAASYLLASSSLERVRKEDAFDDTKCGIVSRRKWLCEPALAMKARTDQ